MSLFLILAQTYRKEQLFAVLRAPGASLFFILAQTYRKEQLFAVLRAPGMSLSPGKTAKDRHVKRDGLSRNIISEATAIFGRIGCSAKDIISQNAIFVNSRFWDMLY